MNPPLRLCPVHKVYEVISLWCRQSQNGNSWLMKVEGYRWLGTYKFSGKSNYITETLYHMDSLYGDKMSDKKLEWKRRN